jgi:hypothetical protein
MLEWFLGCLLIAALCLIVRYTNSFGVIFYWFMAVISVITLVVFLFSDDGGFNTWGSKFWVALGFLTGLNTFLLPCLQANKNAREEKNQNAKS